MKPGSSSASAYRAAPPRFDYQLTDSGRALLPVLDALLAWGLDHAVSSGDPDRDRYRWAKGQAASRKDTMTNVNDATGNEHLGAATLTHSDLARPGPGVARGLTMAGIDYLKAMIAGELPPPPIAALMQFELVEAEPGKVVFTCQPDGSVYNPNGGVHGGLVCTLLDSVAGLGNAQHAACRQGLHVDRDQGELPQGGAAGQPAR